MTAGSTTIVCVASFSDGTDGAMVHARTSGGTNSWWMETAANVWNYGQGVAARNVGGQTNGSWAAYIGRKTTGGANAPRGRKIIFGGATTDTTAGSGLADGTAPGSGGILQVGRWGTASEYLAADVAAVAVFDSDLSDATTATFTTWANIIAASPKWAVHFDQASATDSITDATGNGGNSSSITGTTIVANPSGFFASGSTVTGTAAATLGGLTATAVGTRTVNGAAVAALGRATAPAAGTRTVLGTGAAALGRATATASGTRTVPSAAAAALGALTGAATVGASTKAGTGAAAFGGFAATAAGRRTVLGAGTATLGRLAAATVVTGPVTGLVGEAHGPSALAVGAVIVHTGTIAGAVT